MVCRSSHPGESVAGVGCGHELLGVVDMRMRLQYAAMARCWLLLSLSSGVEAFKQNIYFDLRDGRDRIIGLGL